MLLEYVAHAHLDTFLFDAHQENEQRAWLALKGGRHRIHCNPKISCKYIPILS